MAKAATASKPGGKAKAPSKSEVLNNLSGATGLSRKEVGAGLEALGADIGKYIGKRVSGADQIPVLCKTVRDESPPPRAPKGTHPRTGERVMLKPKPASTTVK